MMYNVLLKSLMNKSAKVCHQIDDIMIKVYYKGIKKTLKTG